MKFNSHLASSDRFLHADFFSNSDFRDSDDASVLTTNANTNITSRDYWFGSMYFRCVLASDLLHCTGSQETIFSVQVCHDQLLQDVIIE